MSSTKNWLEDWFSGKEENKLIERLKMKDAKLGESVRNWCSQIRDQLNIMSSKNFEQYTGHGAQHSDAMLTCLNWLIPHDVIEKMNALEIALLVLAIYHHDIGMAFDLGRKAVLMNDPEWVASREVLIDRFRRSPTVSDKSDSVLEQLAFVEWTRGRHAEESVHWIETERLGKPDYGLGQAYSYYPIWEDIKELCRIHTEPSCDELTTVRCGPGLSGELINLCFLECALRLADECHITVDRADEQMEKFIRFTDEFSRLKWKERQCVASVGPDLDHGLLVINANPPSSDFHRAVVSMGREIKEELERINKTLARKKSPFRFPWLDVDYESQVKTGPNYKYRDWEYNLNRSRVYDLLMGKKLYTDMSVCVRELLQNAVDAVRARWGIRATTGGKITCRRYTKNKDGQDYEVIEVEDNGIGMDEDIVENHLLKVPGESFYRTARFHREHPETSKVLTPIAQHGIGFLSSFMVGKTVEIFTQYDSPKGKAEPIHAELTSLDKGVVYRATSMADFPEGVRHEMGTCVRLWLTGKITDWTCPFRTGKWNKWDNLREIANYWARKVTIPFSIEEDGQISSKPCTSAAPPNSVLIRDDAFGINGYLDMNRDYGSREAKELQVTVSGFYVRRHPFKSLGLRFPVGELDFSGKKDIILTVDRNDFAGVESSKTLARARILLFEAAVEWIKQQHVWDSNARGKLRRLLQNQRVLGENEDLRKAVLDLPIFEAAGENEYQSIKGILEKETYFYIPICPIFRADLKHSPAAERFSKWYDEIITDLRSKHRFLVTGQIGETQNKGSSVVFAARAKHLQRYPLHLLDWLCDARLEFADDWPLLRLSPRNDASSGSHGWSRILDYQPQRKDWLICSTDGNAFWVNPYCTLKKDILGNEGDITSIKVDRESGRRLAQMPADGFLYPYDRVMLRYESDGKSAWIEKTVKDLVKMNTTVVWPLDRVDYWVRRFAEEEEPSDHDFDNLLRILYLDRDSVE